MGLQDERAHDGGMANLDMSSGLGDNGPFNRVGFLCKRRFSHSSNITFLNNQNWRAKIQVGSGVDFLAKQIAIESDHSFLLTEFSSDGKNNMQKNRMISLQRGIPGCFVKWFQPHSHCQVVNVSWSGPGW